MLCSDFGELTAGRLDPQTLQTPCLPSLIPFYRGASNAGPLQDAWCESARKKRQSIALHSVAAVWAQDLGQIAGSAPAGSGQPDRLPL